MTVGFRQAFRDFKYIVRAFFNSITRNLLSNLSSNNEVSYDNKEQQVRVSMDSYHPSSQAMKNQLDFAEDEEAATGTIYKPLGGDVASFDNPVYESDLNLPGEIDNSFGEDEEKKDLSFDNYDYI